MYQSPKLERLYNDHAQALFAFLINMTRNEADTKDLLQELFCKLAQRPELLDGVREERVFLIRLVQNLAIDLMRRSKTRWKNYAQFALEPMMIFTEPKNPDEQAFYRVLSEAIGELPMDQRTVVHLKLKEELTFDEIAKTLDLSPNTVASRYRYALDKLREQLRLLYEEIK